MPLCLPLQFIASGVGPPPARSDRVRRVRVERQVGGVAERSSRRARRLRGSARAASRCIGVPSWLAHTSGEQLGRQRQAGAHHRDRLHRLVRRARVDRDATGRRARTRSSPSAPSATTAPKWTDSSKPLRSVIGDRDERVRVVIGLRPSDLGDRDGLVATGYLRRRLCSGGGSIAVRWLSMTSYRRPTLLRSACAIAAAGSARTAPTAPSTAPPASAEPNASAGMQLHRAGGDARGEQVVLDLLVHDDEDQRRSSAFTGESMSVTSTGQHAGEVRADDGQELADQPDPQRQRDRRRGADAWNTIQWKSAEMPGEQRPRVQVAAGLVDRQLPAVRAPGAGARVAAGCRSRAAGGARRRRGRR